MKLFMCICIVLTAIGASAVADISCNEEIDIHCTNKGFEESIVEEGFNILKEETLKTHCSGILEDIECKRNYLSTCEPDSVQKYNLLTGGLKDMFTDLCDESSHLRTDYRNHRACLENSTTLYNNCTSNAIAASAGNENEVEESIGDFDTNEELLKSICRILNPIENCVVSQSRENCGDEAANFVQGLFLKATKEFKKEKCQ